MLKSRRHFVLTRVPSCRIKILLLMVIGGAVLADLLSLVATSSVAAAPGREGLTTILAAVTTWTTASSPCGSPPAPLRADLRSSTGQLSWSIARFRRITALLFVVHFFIAGQYSYDIFSDKLSIDFPVDIMASNQSDMVLAEQGLPMHAFNKSTPPGWRPGIAKLPLRL